jgi:hypothetical protein
MAHFDGRSRDGVQTTEIELAAKILDCDGRGPCFCSVIPLICVLLERIRNTLSHEMCHLACWIINGNPKEGHGQAFKAWSEPTSFSFSLIVYLIPYKGQQSDDQASRN